MLRIFADDGVTVLFDITTSNVTVLGIVDTGKNSGSINHPMFALGRPVVVSALPIAGTSFTIPDITISGTTITWSFRVDGANYNQPVRIAYGVRG